MGIIINVVIGLIKTSVEVIKDICDILSDTPISVVFDNLCVLVMGEGELNKLLEVLEGIRGKLSLPTLPPPTKDPNGGVLDWFGWG